MIYGMNNITGLTDEGGNLKEEYFYTPYGKLLSKPSKVNPYYFSARRYDEESGLYYFRHRYYLPELGRFTSREPMVSGDLLGRLLNQRNIARNNYMSMRLLKEVSEASLGELLRVVNLYKYAGNNPINQGDSLGLHEGPPGPGPCLGVGGVGVIGGALVASPDIYVLMTMGITGLIATTTGIFLMAGLLLGSVTIGAAIGGC